MDRPWIRLCLRHALVLFVFVSSSVVFGADLTTEATLAPSHAVPDVELDIYPVFEPAQVFYDFAKAPQGSATLKHLMIPQIAAWENAPEQPWFYREQRERYLSVLFLLVGSEDREISDTALTALASMKTLDDIDLSELNSRVCKLEGMIENLEPSTWTSKYFPHFLYVKYGDPSVDPAAFMEKLMGINDLRAVPSEILESLAKALAVRSRTDTRYRRMLLRMLAASEPNVHRIVFHALGVGEHAATPPEAAAPKKPGAKKYELSRDEDAFQNVESTMAKIFADKSKPFNERRDAGIALIDFAERQNLTDLRAWRDALYVLNYTSVNLSALSEGESTQLKRIAAELVMNIVGTFQRDQDLSDSGRAAIEAALGAQGHSDDIVRAALSAAVAIYRKKISIESARKDIAEQKLAQPCGPFSGTVYGTFNSIP